MKRVSSGQIINILQVIVAIQALVAYLWPESWWSWMPDRWIIASMILTSFVTIVFARASSWDGSISQLVFSILEFGAYQSLIFLVTYSPELPSWMQTAYPWSFITTVIIANGGQLFQWLAQKTTTRQVTPMMQ